MVSYKRPQFTIENPPCFPYKTTRWDGLVSTSWKTCLASRRGNSGLELLDIPSKRELQGGGAPWKLLAMHSGQIYGQICYPFRWDFKQLLVFLLLEPDEWLKLTGNLLMPQEHWLKLCTASLLSPVLSARLQSEAGGWPWRLRCTPGCRGAA